MRRATPHSAGTPARRAGSALAMIGLVAALATACTGIGAHPHGTTGVATTAPSPSATPTPPVVTPSPLPTGTAPRSTFAVGTRHLGVVHAGRSLPTTIWYPATRTGPDAPPASGRFPVVVFSHGLNGLPADYAALLSRWAGAGFVVAAPAYPHTARGAADFNLVDVLDQPADASAVLTAVLVEPALRAHLDPSRLGAAGHSAGGITTVGMFTAGRDARLRAGIVLAGNSLGFGTAFSGPAAPLLFVHGDRDTVVSYDSGHSTYAAVPWPKAFLSLPGLGHSDPFVDPKATGFDRIASTTIDFLRYTLYADPAAGHRLGGVRGLDDKL